MANTQGSPFAECRLFTLVHRGWHRFVSNDRLFPRCYSARHYATVDSFLPAALFYAGGVG
jgi:hypothetical protein